jgi:DNA-directed RNA polymerase specialized sigma24 family protein
MFQIEKSRFSTFIFLIIQNQVVDQFSVSHNEVAHVSNKDRFLPQDLDKHLVFHNEMTEGRFLRWLELRQEIFGLQKTA